jgi:hypothetical protein
MDDQPLIVTRRIDLEPGASAQQNPVVGSDRANAIR